MQSRDENCMYKYVKEENEGKETLGEVLGVVPKMNAAMWCVSVDCINHSGWCEQGRESPVFLEVYRCNEGPRGC